MSRMMKLLTKRIKNGWKPLLTTLLGVGIFMACLLPYRAVMNYHEQLTFGISNSIMFVSSAKEGDHLRAEAVSVCDHHKIPSVEVRVTNQDDRLICHVTGMGYRKNQKIVL